MVNGHVIVGWRHSLEFIDGDEKLLESVDFESEQALDRALIALEEDENHPLWPEGSVRVQNRVTAVTRPAIRGVDFGTGSQKRRFGGGRVPRGAYQYKKE